MQTDEKTKHDKNGYILLPEKFTDKKYTLEFIKNIGEWKIYKKSKENSKFITYELIKPKKQESFVIGKNVIAKKWAYPSNENFGRLGFECLSIKRCEELYQEIKDQKEQKNTEKTIDLPKNEKFTIKEVLDKYPKLSYYVVYSYIKELLKNKKIKIVGEIKNKIGKASKIYKLV